MVEFTMTLVQRFFYTHNAKQMVGERAESSFNLEVLSSVNIFISDLKSFIHYLMLFKPLLDVILPKQI